jgi:multiple sugar transport system permease protein
MIMTDLAPRDGAMSHPRRRVGPVRRRERQGLIYVAPAVLLTLLFFIVPLLGTVWTSLRRQPLYGPSTFIGIDNYVNAFQDPVFWSAVWFTFRFMAVVLVVGTLLSFALALLVSQPRRGVGLFRTAVFLPVTMGYASAGFLWYYMLDGRVGVFNDLLMRAGITDDPVSFLSDVSTSFWAIALLTIWKSAGFAMVIFLIGIQAIPRELFEAFLVDGATRLQTVRLLIVPLLRNNIALVVILGVVGGMLTFDQFFVMTKGGPSGQTMTAVYSIFANAFDYQKLGYGSALSVILLGLLAMVSAAQLIIFRRRS